MDDAERNYRAAMLMLRAGERIKHPGLMRRSTRRELLMRGAIQQPIFQQLLAAARGA